MTYTERKEIYHGKNCGLRIGHYIILTRNGKTMLCRVVDIYHDDLHAEICLILHDIVNDKLILDVRSNDN